MSVVRDTRAADTAFLPDEGCDSPQPQLPPTPKNTLNSTPQKTGSPISGKYFPLLFIHFRNFRP
ncbi:hypothetical protein SBA4_6300006 [Candidatus Sulfopaludibacter sp. SbA4]|nr:hypothetical protein SBA4_6300006 [Candidatus Sulfopaludibacter sp. SbA4]